MCDGVAAHWRTLAKLGYALIKMSRGSGLMNTSMIDVKTCRGALVIHYTLDSGSSFQCNSNVSFSDLGLSGQVPYVAPSSLHCSNIWYLSHFTEKKGFPRFVFQPPPIIQLYFVLHCASYKLQQGSSYQVNTTQFVG